MDALVPYSLGPARRGPPQPSRGGLGTPPAGRRAAGYQTVCYTNNGFISDAWGLARGFDSCAAVAKVSRRTDKGASKTNDTVKSCASRTRLCLGRLLRQASRLFLVALR